MKLYYLIAIFELFLLNAVPVVAKDADMTDDQLKQMIMVQDDTTSPRKAIDLALKRQNMEILTNATDNPNWDIKSYAVEAIAALPAREAAQAFKLILKKDMLWSAHVKGGEGQIAQDHFNATLKKAINRSYGITVTDLYDKNIRAKLIESFESYPQR